VGVGPMVHTGKESILTVVTLDVTKKQKNPNTSTANLAVKLRIIMIEKEWFCTYY